jgi:hypothetical protein
MITAIDTNVLLDILGPSEEFYEASAAAMESAANEGTLVICDLVYAELCVHFRARRECDEFLESNDVRLDTLTREAHFLASRAMRTYRQQGGARTRILPDFLIGAHAATQASRLLTRDRGFYRRLFRGLALIDPSDSARPGKN